MRRRRRCRPQRQPPVVAIPWLHGRRRGTPTATTPGYDYYCQGRESSTRTPPVDTATCRGLRRGFVVHHHVGVHGSSWEINNHLIDLWMILSSAVVLCGRETKISIGKVTWVRGGPRIHKVGIQNFKWCKFFYSPIHINST